MRKPLVTSSFLLPEVWPGATSSFLLLVAMPFVPSSFLLLSSDLQVLQTLEVVWRAIEV